VAISVPTGNFGNILAAWAAKQMGVPVQKFIVGSNRNDILARFLAANDMSAHGVEPSLSPSMDIQVSSNFERLLYEFLGRDAALLSQTMADFREHGKMHVADGVWRTIAKDFKGFRLSDEQTLAEIARLHRETGYLADPHSIIGIAAARELGPIGMPVIAAATAHPAKFPDAIEKAVGRRPPLPPHLSDLYEREEKFIRAPRDLAAIEERIRNFANRNVNV
jgi:threonine synthase